MTKDQKNENEHDKEAGDIGRRNFVALSMAAGLALRQEGPLRQALMLSKATSKSRRLTAYTTRRSFTRRSVPIQAC
jgi:hypothetical protein